MTPEQVVGASGGSATRGNDELSVQGDQTKGAQGTYVSGEYAFRARYWFTAGKLTQVDLTFTDANKCPALGRDLLAKYGDPVERSGGSVARRMWRDAGLGNRVTLITTGDFCDLQYAPLISADGAGL